MIQKKIKLKITGTAMTSIINCAGLILRESYLGTMIIFTTFLIVLLMIAAKVKEAKIQERGGNSCEKVQENDS